MKTVEMKRVSELCKFDPMEFCVDPSWWGLEFVSPAQEKELFEEAKKLAGDVDGICVCFIHDGNKTYVLAETWRDESVRIILFNAKVAIRPYEEPELAPIVRTSMGDLPFYWTAPQVLYKKGEIVQNW